MISHETKTNGSEGRALFMLWLGAFLPLFAWGLHLSLVSLLAPLVCESVEHSGLYSLALLALVIDGLGGATAWRCYRPTIGESASAGVKRRRYFGLVGMLGSVIFGIAIVVQTLTVSLYTPC